LRLTHRFSMSHFQIKQLLPGKGSGRPWLPLTLVSRAVNMLSVHSEGSAHDQRSRRPLTCLGDVVAATHVSFFPSLCPSRIHLLASLCSTGVTPLLRSYGRSDSDASGSSAPVSMNTVLVLASVSLLTSRHAWQPFRPQPPGLLPSRPLPWDASGRNWVRTAPTRLRLSLAGSSQRPGRIGFTFVADWSSRLGLLSTSPCGDAVTSGFGSAHGLTLSLLHRLWRVFTGALAQPSWLRIVGGQQAVTTKMVVPRLAFKANPER